ncbi:hypothetical protein AGABI1DRAFT_127061 [Agaricus bisporus var. burnettii JB137-S8]|uniref:histone deacetylase n=1 Tax=Agaricus bisporus var. burnettii (strain JB137-S8 / ATCC MYA-4627 / FGSC 10392) TaxID=597362 RepID=K5W2J4_AGABU|nr:uncharacterized protein AGABI1DRAFT_127061 [Agaricus bisporus var. burnettii JB137-S8]EKM81019.1 hypothetical protein AGABI1DRAFT_127061 [Agaricus bisporus var. burnettii JB137-S8]
MEVDNSAKDVTQNAVIRPRALSVPFKPPVANYTVGYVYSSEMTTHLKLGDDPHPEQPQRIVRIWKMLSDYHYIKRMLWLPIRPVTREEALLVHTEDHWDKVQAIQYMTDQQIVDSEAYYEQLSLYVMAGTTRAALLSCGGVIEAALAVAQGRLKKTLAIVRPPGHHAEPDEHMGFCFFNNIAVAARVVQQLTPIKKILILDWDVHHGNGTQRAFNDDPSVLYMSLHRYEQGNFYPTGPFGSMQSCGEEAGLGYSVNVPWPCAGVGDADYIYAFQKVILPIGLEFAPDLVMISAGFDAAAGDELGECLVTPAGYAHMTHMLAGLANGRMVVALEGGYNLDSNSVSALAVTKVLLGEAPDQLPPLVASDEGTETVWLVAKEQSKYWKSVDPRACEPREDLGDITFSIPEILKAHRQHYLYTEHSMMQIPLLRSEMEQPAGIMKLVKAVIQVLGPQKMPTVPGANEDIRSWYRKRSFVIVPTTHPFLSPHMRAKDLRRHGTIIPIDERRQIKLISTGLPAIQEIVAQSITDKIPVNNTTVNNPPTAKAVG